MYFSIIIPVYNRPDEIKELLDSLCFSTYTKEYEIVIVEDGSTISSEDIVKNFKEKLNISYYFKENSGPGDSRNFGMNKAKGDYFIIFDSDCIIPKNYLNEVENELKGNYVDCFGGSDRALKSFSNIQKAINFSMTSFLTTGGIRGASERIDKFQPRSFNMGISKTAFQKSGGFGNIHPGEDPDLSIRLWKMGFKTRLFKTAFVYHKRRIDWDKFSTQVSKFGKARPILNYWYPKYSKITYWFPAAFILGLIVSILTIFIFFDWQYNDIFLKMYFAYFILIFVISSIQNKNPYIGFLSIIATWKQFTGYGLGFLESFFRVHILKQKPEKAFPELFFKKNKHQNTSIDDNANTIIERKIDTNDLTMQKKSILVGITGGIGSGKSTVAKYLLEKGFPVYISDLEAKKVMESPEIVSKITELFGKDILLPNAILNREKLASIVFNNPEKLKLLNAVVHPAVKIHFENWKSKHNNSKILFKEAAILFESGSYKDCDFIISVVAPQETRIGRVIARDKTTREKVLQRIENQISDEERIAKSNFTITNITLQDTINQIDNIIKILKNK